MIKYLLPLVLLAGCDSTEVTKTVTVQEPVFQQFITEDTTLSAPTDLIVYHTLHENWRVPEGAHNPRPYIRIDARLDFQPTDAEYYTVLVNDDSIKILNIAEIESQTYDWSFEQVGLAQDLRVEHLPDVKILVTQGGGVGAQVSESAQWVSE